jgi:hypothetical protein
MTAFAVSIGLAYNAADQLDRVTIRELFSFVVIGLSWDVCRTVTRRGDRGW